MNISTSIFKTINTQQQRLWVLQLLVLVALTAVGCAAGPKPADWQLETKGALERSVAAYLEGNSRVEAVELSRARREVSSTGRVDLIARTELVHCASHVASLEFEACTGFEKLRQDAPPAERAYADYLAAKLSPQDALLLPAQHRSLAASQAEASGAGDAALKSITDPLSQLVAAGVLLQKGQASPAVVQMAVDAASAQGWRRPLLAWLGVQLKLAEKGGDSAQTARLRRQIDLTQGDAKAAR